MSSLHEGPGLVHGCYRFPGPSTNKGSLRPLVPLAGEEQSSLVMAGALLLALRQELRVIVPVLILGAVGLVWHFAIPGNWICGLFLEYRTHFVFGARLFYVHCLPQETEPVPYTRLLG
jgi:hypothetical protein